MPDAVGEGEFQRLVDRVEGLSTTVTADSKWIAGHDEKCEGRYKSLRFMILLLMCAQGIGGLAAYASHIPQLLQIIESVGK